MVKERKYTQSGLPVVSEDVCRVEVRDLVQRYNEGKDSFIKYIESKVKEIRGDNPKLADLLDGALEVLGEEDPQMKGDFLIGVYFVYDALNRQAEINKLEEDLNNKI